MTSTRSRGPWPVVASVAVLVVIGLVAALAGAGPLGGSVGGATRSAAAAERSAGEPASWTRYVDAPATRTVRPVRVLAATAGVSDPDALLTGGATTLTRAEPAALPAWATGTTAAATGAGTRAEGGADAGAAIDGDATTTWSDAAPGTVPGVDTARIRPVTLVIRSPVAAALAGITIRSAGRGMPRHFTVATWTGSTWRHAATVTGNTAVQRAVAFADTVTTSAVRIRITSREQTGRHGPLRIDDIAPGVVPAAAPSITLDFGEDVVGIPTLRFAAGSSGRPGLRLAFSETRQYLSETSDFTRSDNAAAGSAQATVGYAGTDQVAVPDGAGTWTDARGCSAAGTVCADGLHAFRYLRITLDALATDAPATRAFGQVRLTGVSLHFTGYLGTPSTYRGWFESSSPALNRYWYGASYTNELATAVFRSDDTDARDAASASLEGKAVLTDGAKRDRDPYVGDVAVSGLTEYLTHGDGTAARNVLADLAAHQRADGYIPPASIRSYGLHLFDYPLWWVTSSWDYLRYTGDRGYGRSSYAALRGVLDRWYPSVTDRHGLLSRGRNGTAGYGDYAFLPRHGEVTYDNALYVLALKDAARTADALGHPSDARRWRARAARVARAVDARLWDPTVGAYLDARSGAVRHGQDGNALAVVAGIASRARATSALRYLGRVTTLPYGNAFEDDDSLVPDGAKRVYAFTSYQDILARFSTGLTASALGEIRRLYGWMSRHDPGTTDWEGIGAGGSLYEAGYTSAAHGWSTGVLPALTTDLLGAAPTGVGFATWSVRPHPGGVHWARGRVPTPNGALAVSWHRYTHRFTLRVSAPVGTSGTIAVPAARGARVRLDGRMLHAGDAHGSRWVRGTVVIRHVGPGEHRVAVVR